jgi:hypothetical protein
MLRFELFSVCHELRTASVFALTKAMPTVEVMSLGVARKIRGGGPRTWVPGPAGQIGKLRRP